MWYQYLETTKESISNVGAESVQLHFCFWCFPAWRCWLLFVECCSTDLRGVHLAFLPYSSWLNESRSETLRYLRTYCALPNVVHWRGAYIFTWIERVSWLYCSNDLPQKSCNILLYNQVHINLRIICLCSNLFMYGLLLATVLSYACTTGIEC